MHLSENEGIEGKTFVVTGGLGFVGSSLCLELIRRGARLVRAFDFKSDSPFSHLLLNHNKLQLIKGDIVNRKDVDKALRGVDCVFHLASFGMSGKEMLQYGRVDDVNINGTCHVLEACHQNGVKRLVYVSTSNVVFARNEIVNGNEKLPYIPLDNYVDPYSRSKSIAEQLVLKSNGRPLKMHLSEIEGIEGKSFVVTGGLGFVGSSLCLELIRRGARLVRAFDFKSDSPFSHFLLNHNNLQLIKGDITNRKDVDKALRGVDCVFHLASFGMSGKEMLQYGRVDDVNINGTCHVLEACHQNGVKRLVYVSTSNVVFARNEIVNGNEKLPYIPLDNYVDPYSRSKSIAEQLVLKSNGRPLKDKNGECLYTCAVRPAAIYGPGEERHLPRIINLAKLGLLPFKIGEPSVKSDWVYIDNLVLALIQASMGLLDDIPGRGKQPIAAGQPYFISDGSPVNTFEFLRPLLKSLEYDMPKATLPVSTALFVGKVFSVMYTVMYPWLNRGWLPQPLLLPAEVYKVGVTHYFNYLKAKQELGYTPIKGPQEGMAATISFYQDRKRKSLDGPTIYEWFFCVFGMSAVIGAAFFPVPILRPACLFIIRSLLALRILAVWAIAMHAGESIYAWRLAKRVDPANSRGWALQTFVLGVFSLKFLLKRAKQ